MRLYIQVAFWLGILSILARLFMLSAATYPRTVTYKRWEDAWAILLASVIAMWGYHLVWGVR